MTDINVVSITTESVDLTTTDQTDVYVVPKSFSAIVKNFFISNSNAGNINYTLKFYHKDDNVTHTLLDTHAVGGKQFETVFDTTRPFFMHAEDKLIVQAATANELVATLCIEQFYNPNRKNT